MGSSLAYDTNRHCIGHVHNQHHAIVMCTVWGIEDRDRCVHAALGQIMGDRFKYDTVAIAIHTNNIHGGGQIVPIVSE